MSDRRLVSLATAARAVLDARAGGRAVAVVARADEEGRGARLLVFADGESRGTLGDARLDGAARAVGKKILDSGDAVWTLESGDPAVTLYAEAHRPGARLFVVGAGHIAVPLVEIGTLLGYPVTVLDDRDEMATPDRFPAGVAVRRVDFADPFAEDAPGPDDAVVLVTRAHRYDFDCLRRLLDADPPPRYIGMVGSRRRVRAAFRKLLEAGVSGDRLAAVHAPIGVDIGAETPEEIAVSIAAELVAARREVDAGGSLRDAERIMDRLGKS